MIIAGCKRSHTCEHQASDPVNKAQQACLQNEVFGCGTTELQKQRRALKY